MRSIEQLICWQEKDAFRILRKQFHKGELVKMRCLYDTITEIDSDFKGWTDELVSFIDDFDVQADSYYVKIIHTYSGLPENWIPEGLKKFQELGILIKKRGK